MKTSAQQSPNGIALGDVFTLEEAAQFMRVSSEAMRKQAESGAVPGKKIDGEWRFWRGALVDWLSGKMDGKTRLLQMAGVFKDDEMLPEIVREIYRARGRSEEELEELVQSFPVLRKKSKPASKK